MKKFSMLLAAATVAVSALHAQTVVNFNVNDTGKKTPVRWGMDTAWDDLYNVNWGVAHYGANFQTGRISFQPYELVDASKINDASANFGLPLKMARKLQMRIDHIKMTGTTTVAINCDHEVLTRKLDDYGNYGGEEDNVGKGNYQSTRSAMKTEAWVNLIKASVKYAQAQGLTVESVSPFNEPDYGWNQFYNGTPGTSTNNQQNYGMRDLKAIYTALKADDFFKIGAGKDIRMCGPNTLNDDRAMPWYNYNGMAAVLDEGNTHQLSGTFDNYANFFTKVRQDGKVATADELHNVGEAIVGVEYGMQNGIWWAFDAKARGQFMIDSNEGSRIGYAEDRTHWTSAAVYRNDKEGSIHGFIGSSERQANVSTYKFVSNDCDVYFNGYGPQREWSVTTVGGASGSYQQGQINYEYLFDITYGEDVQSFAVDGNYQVMNAATGRLLTSNATPNDVTAVTQKNNNTQRWHIYPDNARTAGDCSYWFIDNLGDAAQHLNLRDGNIIAGAKVLTYNANHDALEQWYFRYAGDGYFYIITRRSNKYLYANNTTISVQNAPTDKTPADERAKYLWRLMPIDAPAETTAPAVPAGLAASLTETGVALTWNALVEANVSYNVLRQDANGWNTIARCVSGTTFSDAKAEAGKSYNYKVQAVDYSGNRSAMSDAINIVVEQQGDVPAYDAGQWEWLGETAAAGSCYIFNKANQVFLKKTSAVDKNPANATLFTLSATTNATISYSDNGTKYIYESGGTASWGTINTNTWTIQSQTGGYYIYHKDPGYRYGTRNRYISMNATTVSYPYTSFNDNNRLLQFISTNQMTKYGLMSDYNAAFVNAKNYLASELLSPTLMEKLKAVLAANAAKLNYLNIEDRIAELNAIAAECQAYIDNPPVIEGEDMTGLIINPSIIQNRTAADMPTGWTAGKDNVTGNGHCTEGTGNTRLEAWSTLATLKADYYQNIVAPNGLYTLKAVTHQRANGNAALYGETYRLFETTMPVGDGNEAETAVQHILVTDGQMRIGVKVSGLEDVDQWMTADNFSLIRVSRPEDTPLSHYQAAINYLKELADVELQRDVDHEDLLAAIAAADICEQQATAYEKAINELLAAILRSQAMEERSTETGDASDQIPSDWIGATGFYRNLAAERYNGDSPYGAGRLLYQRITNLIPGALYEIEFYAVANVARNLSSQYYGSGIAYLFANDVEEDIDVIFQDACDFANYPRKLTAAANANGVIEYGIANRKSGGQWYVAKAKSLKCVGIAHSATLSVKANKFGTFVAPYVVEMPAGVTAYSAEVVGDGIVLTPVAEPGETLAAGTPVVLRNVTASPVSANYTGYCDNDKTIYDEVLVGTLKAGVTIPIHSYVLQTLNGEQAFYIVNTPAFPSTQNRCYIAPQPAAALAASLCILFDDDEATEIFGVSATEESGVVSWYSVDGTPLASPQRGVNIGKKANGETVKVVIK